MVEGSVQIISQLDGQSKLQMLHHLPAAIVIGQGARLHTELCNFAQHVTTNI